MKEKVVIVEDVIKFNCLCIDENGRTCKCGVTFKHLYNCPGCGRPKWCAK